jgi:glycosyltransferase involved in cell wall biosynthesis
MHFLRVGLKQGRTPHPLFNSEYVASQKNHYPRSHMEYYRRFLNGEINASPHPLVDIEFIKKQIGHHFMPHEIFRLLADEGEVIDFMPHPLFDPSYYAKHQVMAVPNALMDYVLNRPVDGESHPLFSPSFYLTHHPISRFHDSVLAHYLRCWSNWMSDPSLFVDLHFAVQQQKLSRINSNQDPLVEALKSSSLTDEPTLNPCIEPRCVRFAFTNLLAGRQSISDAQQFAYVIEASTPKEGKSSDRLGSPVLSVVIVNSFQPAGTALSIYSALNALSCLEMEIIVVETGGEITRHAELRRLFAKIQDVHFCKIKDHQRLVDGNNIGADRARGRYVLFLHAGSVLHHSWGAKFSEMLLTDSLPEASMGQRHNPDGVVEEVDAGIAEVRAFFSEFADAFADRDQLFPVDSISGGCLLICQRALSKVIGFDPALQPFFDEADLCCRLEKAGILVTITSHLRFMRSNVSCSRTSHIGEEAAPSRIYTQTLFVRRWLSNPIDANVLVTDYTEDKSLLFERQVTARAVAVIYTPFPIWPDERNSYLLSIARCLAPTYDIVICTDDVVSIASVRFSCLSLGIDPFLFTVKTYSEICGLRGAAAIAIILGNQIVPPIPPVARTNIYLLEFPYPSRNPSLVDFDRIEQFDAILVSSDFTLEWTQRRLREAAVRDAPRIMRLYPPIHGRPRARARSAGHITIITNGRFSVGSRSKRQDVFLEIVEAARAISSVPVKAVIIGTPDDCLEAQIYYKKVTQQARLLGGVRQLSNASPSEVARELSEADIFLECAGYNVATQAAPEDTEHFGIFLAEAIAAGCYPLVYCAGIPVELVRNGGIGQTFVDAQEAAAMICQRANAKMAEVAEPRWIRELSIVNFEARLAAVIAEFASV